MIVNFVTSCGDRCGIASYSRNLLKSNLCGAEIKKVCLPKFTFNPFSYFFAGISAGRGCNLIHIQYQQGIFGCVLPIPILRAINHFPLFFIPLFIYRLLGKKVVYTIHESNPSNPWQLLVLFLINLTADKLLVHSDELIPILLNNRISKSKIEYMPHPILERHLIPKSECRKKFEIAEKSFVLLMFGFIHENKGFDLVLSAMPHLPNHTELVIVGSARTPEHRAYLSSLKKKASELKLEQRVRFIDYLPDAQLPVAFSVADLAVLPYRWIQTSGAMTDLLSFNLPVLTSDLPHFKSIKSRYSCIETFKTQDSADLVEKLQSLIGNPQNLAKLSSATKKFVSEASVSRVMSRTCNIYEALLSHQSKKS